MWLIHVTYLFSSISNTVNSFKKKIVLNENYLKNEFSVSTDRGTSLGPEVIKLFSCSTQLSMKFYILINIKIAKVNGIFRFKSPKPVIYPAHKMLTIVGILTFMSMINCMLSRVEHEKSFITSGPGLIYVGKLEYVP